MRNIPTELQQLFSDQQGVQPIFVIGISWAGAEEILYSTREIVGAYQYVSEFSNYESVSSVEGLGAVSSISVTFNDQFGHFKEKIDTIDFFDKTTVCTVYIIADKTDTLFDLFEGFIDHPIVWTNKKLKIDIISSVDDKEIGYTPALADVDLSEPNYDYIAQQLNTEKMWPMIFGSVYNNETTPVLKKLRAITTEETTQASRISLSGGIGFRIPIEFDHAFIEDTTTLIAFVGKDKGPFAIVGSGKFIDISGDKFFEVLLADIKDNWYEDIPITAEENSSLFADDIQPEDTKFSRYILEPDENTLGPDGLVTDQVWLQYAYVKIRVTYEGASGERSYTFITRCVKQNENVITVDNATVVIIDEEADEPTFLIVWVKKATEWINNAPAGTEIVSLEQSDFYVVDDKIGTTVTQVALRSGDDLIVIASNLYTISSVALWVGDPSPSTYIVMSPLIIDHWLEHYTEKNTSKEGILVNASNTVDTLTEVIETLSKKTTIANASSAADLFLLEHEDLNDIITEICWESLRAIRRTRLSGEEIFELISLVNPGNTVFTFDNTNILKDSIKYSFTDQSELYTIIKATRRSNNMLAEVKDLLRKNNITRYGNEKLDVNYYTFASLASANNSLDYWIDKLSTPHYVIAFTGFLDAFGLEVWDRVQINISEPTFYDPADGSPLTKTHTATTIPWKGKGFIKMVIPRIDEGLIDFIVELDLSINGPPNEDI